MKLETRKLAICFTVLLFLFSSNIVFGQKTVTGKVTDETNNPLPNVSVTVKGTSNGTVTDANGNFSLNVPAGRNLIEVSNVGDGTQEISVSGKTSVGTIALVADSHTLNEVVVTGYTSQLKKDITGSVSVVNVQDMNKQPTGSLANQLQGQASGITIIGSGQPGETPQITIRGINTFGNNTPLFIIDGVPTQNISDINPNDVASVQILKDAGAASI